jgi:aminopeptidase N
MSFTLLQEAPEEHPTLRSHRLRIGLYDRTSEGVLRREQVELDVAGARTEVPALVGKKQPDFILINDDDLAYAKIRLDERSLRSLVNGIADIRESLPRSLCWAAAWDMTRDAEMRPRDYLRLVLEGVGRESDSSVIRVLLGQAGSVVRLYVTPSHRVEAKALLADGLDKLLREAAPGSDPQLQFARALAAHAVSPLHLDTIAGLLDGSVAIEGLAIDTDLRWTLLYSLVSAGRAGDSEIDAELARDNTATGARHAASCRAARPTPEAKAEAWAAVVERDDLPNALLTATIGGWADPDHLDLLRPYVEPYFAAIKDVWATRTNETAQSIVVGLYPTMLADQALLDRTDAWLAEAEPVPALRRLVLEARDGVARVLRAQARDAQA